MKASKSAVEPSAEVKESMVGVLMDVDAVRSKGGDCTIAAIDSISSNIMVDSFDGLGCMNKDPSPL